MRRLIVIGLAALASVVRDRRSVPVLHARPTAS